MIEMLPNYECSPLYVGSATAGCFSFAGIAQLPHAAWAVRDSNLPRTCFAATPCTSALNATVDTNCTVVQGSTVAVAFQQSESGGTCYALSDAAGEPVAALLDAKNASAGLRLTYSGGVGGRSVSYSLMCDDHIPEAGPTAEVQKTTRSMTYDVMWPTPHACGAVAAPAASCAAPKPPPPPPAAPVAVPSPQQLAWQDLEISAMLGWNLQTICAARSTQPQPSPQHCQAAGYVPTAAQVAAWNPMNLDTDAWAAVSASFGAKYIVMVADHMTGFTWWDTKYHNYSIAHTKYKGGGVDLVKEMIASCKKYDLKLGFFYSVHFNWFLGVDGFKVGHPPLGPTQYTQAEYVAIAQGQLAEIIAMFGDEGPLEVWFDGGTGSSATAVSETIKANAPNAVCHSCYSNFTRAGSVRWMGNEEAMMPLPSWGADDGEGSKGGGGNPLGGAFMPPSSDAVIREHYWFWKNNTEEKTKSTLKLVQNYLTSVGRASNYILNVAPDNTGRIPPSDVARYAEMGTAIKCLWSQPVATSSQSSLLVMDNATSLITWTLPAATTTVGGCTNCSLVVREDQTRGQLIGAYTLQCRAVGAASTDWSACTMGSLGTVIRSDAAALTGVGHKRILLLNVAGGKLLAAIRMKVVSHYAVGTQLPTLRDLALFDWGGNVEHCV